MGRTFALGTSLVVSLDLGLQDKPLFAEGPLKIKN